MNRYFLFILFVGLVIRLMLIGNPGFLADISFWKSWSLAAVDHGIVWTAYNTNINYPPGFIYVLWLMGKIYTLFGNPHDFNTFWQSNNFGFLLSSKSIAIVSDIIIACLIYWFFSQKKKLEQLGITIKNLEFRNRIKDVKLTDNLPLLLSLLFFLNPVVIIDSAIWGQVESFGLLFTLLAIVLLFYRRPLLATTLFTVGILMKLQNIIYIPLYFLFIFRFFDIRTTFKSLACAAATFFLVNLPFVLTNNLHQVLYLMIVNSDYFPWLSLNAQNLWWIVANAAGMQITDKITVLGILNAKTVGLLIFAVSYLSSVVLILRKPTPRNFILSLVIGVYAFFLFTTQSHERYSYPVIVLLLFFYPFIVKNTNISNQNSRFKAPSFKQISNQKHQISNVLNFVNWNLFGNWKLEIGNYNIYFWFLYALFTITVFCNIHYGLIVNYPQNGFASLTRISTPQLSIFNSYVSILLFFLLLPYVLTQISWLIIPTCLLILGLGLILGNLSYIRHSQVSLTSFKPIITKQDYASLQVNKSVNSFPGWKSWNRLSNNYFYYRKGFGTHANSTLVFDIDRKFKSFSTDFGVDTEAPTLASIVFKIYGDGKELFASSKMGRFDFPQHAEVEVTGVKHLKLEVNDAGDGINSDHADWLNPVLYR